MKCIVLNCENHSHEGRMYGELCGPCYMFITTGEGKHSQAYRNARGTLKLLSIDEIDKVVWENTNNGLMLFTVAIQKALLEKNT